MSDKSSVVYTLITKFALLLLTLVSGVIVARLLGPEGRGEYTIIILLASMTASLFSFNLGESAIFFLSKRRSDLGSIVYTDLVFIGILTVISVFILTTFWLLGYLPWHELDRPIMFFFTCLYIPALFFQLHALDLIRAVRRFRLYNTFLIIQPAIYLALVLIFVVILKLGVIGALISGLSASVVVGVTSFGILMKSHFSALRWNGSYLREVLIYGIKGHVGNVLHKCNLRLDQFFVSPLWGAAALGQYGIAVSLTEIIWYLADSIGIVTLPRLASSSKVEAVTITARSLRINVFITFLLCIGLLLLARPVILTLYGRPFEPAVVAVYFLLPGVFAMGFSKIISKYFSGQGRPELNSLTSLVSVIVTVLLCPLLIKKYGIAGAAAASSLAYVARMMLDVTIFWRDSHFPLSGLFVVRSEDLRDIAGLVPFLRITR